MDTIFTRLEEASRVGDVDSLKRLLEEDKLLLERVIARTSAKDNPLHIAALLGHADFAAEIINRKPELAKELNGQGLSPLHLAAAHNHLAVVKELLKGGVELCLVMEEKEGLMPLHVAVIKGRTLIVKELLEACEVAMHKRTHGGETMLHLAVKSNSLETLELLISRVDDLKVEDDKGYTMLHLAVARKQSSVIKLLLSKRNLDVNFKNSKGFTPLDVLLESRHEYGDLILGEMVIAAGGTTATRQQTSLHVLPDPVSSQGPHSTPQPGTPKKPLRRPSAKTEDIEKANLESGEKSTKEIEKHNPDMLMVVATLIATITFGAALNPPGGFQADGIYKGQAVLAHKLSQFLIFDMIGLFCSVSVIFLFLCVVPNKQQIVMKFLVWVLWLATFSTVLAFTLAIDQIFVDNDNAVNILIVGWLVVLMLGILWVGIRLIIFCTQERQDARTDSKILFFKKSV
ncbi:hypothetical protein LUZ60_014931 [Juncus effusus]|nr:hypothetical protein LUZ60_014931 [Juncus effusus]